MLENNYGNDWNGEFSRNESVKMNHGYDRTRIKWEIIKSYLWEIVPIDG